MKPIKVQLTPYPAPRPRFSRYGTYNPKKYTDYKNNFLQLSKIQCKTHFNGALRLDVTFFMQIPKSLSKKKHIELIGDYHIKKPDADNLIKTVKDSLEGTFYKNDSQICEIFAKKVYSTEPRTEFLITEIGEE